jgi:SAM-dependent methyltransferase
VTREADHVATWTDYYEANDARPPRELLLGALDRFEHPGDAIDLGCGAGIDTAAMLGRGWSVVATDEQPEAIDRLRRRIPAGSESRLRTEVTPMETFEPPGSDLVWASFSLFFCDPDRFADVWARLLAALRPGGRFAGQLLGDRDSWAGDEGITWFDRAGVDRLLEPLTVERFMEEDEDGSACSGPKHWHVFHVVARAPLGPTP